ncbi:MAG: TolC family protein [Nitrospinae bacterium]|nr:TolC family protein [Nitrospinota bacterium]
MKKNVGISVLEFNSKVKEQAITDKEADFDPQVSAKFTGDKSIHPVSSALASPNNSLTENLNWEAGLKQKAVTGGDYELKFTNKKTDVNSVFAGLNPQYSSELKLTLTQPLLKNFGVDINKKDIHIAQNDRTISEFDFKKQVIDIISNTESVYWNLAFSIEDLKVKEKSLERARDFEKIVKAQVDVGAVAPLEILQAQSEVASREEFVIAAKDLIKDNEENLKNILNMPFESPEGQKALLPVDQPVYFAKNDIDLNEAIKEALTNRPDYLRKKKELENKNIVVKYSENQMYPSVDLVGSLGLNGIAGDARSITSLSTGTTSRSPFSGGYGETLDNLASRDYYSWEVGVKMNYPLGNRSAKSRLTAARLEVEQTLLDIKDLEKKIVVDAREAVRQIGTDAKQVEATRVAVKLAEEKLKAEEKKFKVGLSTSFNVLQFQEDLAKEQSNQIKAVIDYNKTLIKLRQVMGNTLERHNIQLSTRTMGK